MWIQNRHTTVGPAHQSTGTRALHNYITRVAFTTQVVPPPGYTCRVVRAEASRRGEEEGQEAALLSQVLAVQPNHVVPGSDHL
jgi:hypothetical protein